MPVESDRSCVQVVALVKAQKKGMEIFHMTRSMRALLMGAALTGFVAGTTLPSSAQDKDKDKPADSDTKATKSKREEHACKGRTPAKARVAADQPKARTIAKARAMAGPTASQWKSPSPWVFPLQEGQRKYPLVLF